MLCFQMASKKGTSKVDKVDSADLNQSGLGQTSQISVNKNACFACAMCPNRLFDAIDKVRGHVEDEHSINVREIVDKLIKLPATNYLRSFRCVACPASARYVFEKKRLHLGSYYIYWSYKCFNPYFLDQPVLIFVNGGKFSNQYV